MPKTWASPNDCPRLLYLDHFVDEDSRRELETALDQLPVVPAGDPRRFDQLALSHPVIDEVVVTGRLEGAAGHPVWRQGATVGPPVPAFLKALGRLASDAIETMTGERHDFTSVYVDRFDAGGYFVPHTDRACYGPLVAGISLGDASCMLRFEKPDTDRRFHTELRPGSLYAFSGEIREPPWLHSTSGARARRWVVTFRTAAH